MDNLVGCTDAALEPLHPCPMWRRGSDAVDRASGRVLRRGFPDSRQRDLNRAVLAVSAVLAETGKTAEMAGSSQNG